MLHPSVRMTPPSFNGLSPAVTDGGYVLGRLNPAYRDIATMAGLAGLDGMRGISFETKILGGFLIWALLVGGTVYFVGKVLMKG